MDLLFVTRWPPDENGGGTQQRAAASLRALAGCGRVHMLCLADEVRPLPDALRPLVSSVTDLAQVSADRGHAFRFNRRQSLMDRMLRSAWGMSGLISRMNSQEAAMVARALPLSAFDGVFAFHLGAACVVDRLGVLKAGARKIIDWDFLESSNVVPYARLVNPHPALKQKAAEQFNRLKVWWWERDILRHWDQHLCSSAADVAYLAARAHPQAQVASVNNSALIPSVVSTPPLERPPTVLFVGTMAYQPNQDAVVHFLADIWPSVRQRVPLAEFKIVGRAMPPSLLSHNGRDGITVHADAPDVTSYYAQSHVAIVPLRFVVGSNLKVPEAMAHGRAVVGYRAACARHGLSAADGVVSVDDRQQFVLALSELLLDIEGTGQLGLKAYRAATERFSRDAIDKALAGNLRSIFKRASE